jgi:CelD/BcsL family acetyltransferase involved in cellulose biosynthesis
MRFAPLRPATCTRLLGAGRGGVLTELPQVLTSGDVHREAMRAIAGAVMEGERASDWVEVSLSPAQGWAEPEWLPQPSRGGRNPVMLTVDAAATVVLDLPATLEDLQRQIKPSLRKSIARGRNRLDRDGVAWRFDAVASPGPELSVAIDTLIELHHARADVRERLRHDDSFADPRQVSFLHDAGQALAASGHLKVCRLMAGEETIASVLMLRANGTAFLSVSGMDPAYWRYAPVTLVQRSCLDDALLSGDRRVNFLRGPNYAKLRWGEELDVYHTFRLVSGRWSSHVRYGLYGPYQSLAEFRVRARQRAAGDFGGDGTAPSSRPMRARAKDLSRRQ